MANTVADQLRHTEVIQNTSSSEPSATRDKRSTFPRHAISPERVLKSFNTRAFKREQPDKPELMLQVIAQSIARNEPVPFVLYWGKGPRASLGRPEIKCLDYLASLADRVRQCYAPGASITLIYTDTHADLNGHTPQTIRAYFNELTAGAYERGFETMLLSELLRRVELPPEAVAADTTVPEDLLRTLRSCASKWFRGNGTVEEGAVRYYRLNMVEKRVVERIFPHAIFVTFNGSEMQSLFPEHLPTFYMYSVRHGVCDKPWFLPADFVSHNAPSNANRLELAQSA